MNQINLDALLQIGSGRTQPNLQSLKLTPDTLYQALLNIGSDGTGQLHVATPQGPVQIQLTPQQTALLLQATPQSPAALQNQVVANQVLATQVTLSGQLQGQLTGKLSEQASGQVSGQASDPRTRPDAGQQLPIGNQPSPAAHKPLTLQLLLQPGAAGQLHIQTQQAPVQIPLQPSQLLQLLGSQQQQPLTMLVQLQRQQQQLLLTLPNQQQLQLPASWLEGAAEWPAQQPKMAQLTVQLVQGQLKISITLQDAPTERSPSGTEPAKQAATALNIAAPPATPASDKLSTTTATAASQPHKAQVLSTAQTNALLPVLAKALQPAGISVDSGQLQLGKLELPYAISKTGSLPNWQLQAVPAGGKTPAWQLQLSVDPAAATPIKVESAALNRPVLWQPSPTTNQAATHNHLHSQQQQQPKIAVDVSNAWRQWLPLQNPSVDPLLELPELPPAVLAILKELKAQTLDTSRPIQQTQLQQQLTAALQFNPLQQLSQTNSSASTLAVALQLLLGRLGNQPTADLKSSPAQRLQNLVAQLDQTQSSQLLKQLAGHASKMQGAQFATAEQAQTPQQHQQLFIQLPLVQQGESRFAELALTEREADGKAGEAKRQQWQLTMKFDLADAGNLLVQVRLTGLEVSLQFYAEQVQVVSSAEQFLPLLKDRLKMQGLQVTEAQCQLGKIPEQLFARSNSLVAVRV